VGEGAVSPTTPFTVGLLPVSMIPAHYPQRAGGAIRRSRAAKLPAVTAQQLVRADQPVVIFHPDLPSQRIEGFVAPFVAGQVRRVFQQDRLQRIGRTRRIGPSVALLQQRYDLLKRLLRSGHCRSSSPARRR
jgi:hypothetical protein